MKSNAHKKRIVLLDAHAIIHRAYHALPDFSSTKGEPTGALYGLCTMLLKIVNDLSPDFIAACYDLPSPTHRHDAYEAYKGTRKKIDDELVAQLERSKDIFIAFGIPIYSAKGFEADDVLGTIVEKLSKDDNVEVVIASGDMDTLQLVSGEKVKVYTLRKGISDTVLYDEDRVKERFGFGPELLADYKGLRGDPSDNIIGVRGIGEKTATDLIQKFGSIENLFLALKKDKDAVVKEGVKERIADLLLAHEDEARFSKTLATIRRDATINFSLPTDSWKNQIDMARMETLFKELEFKTLLDRVKDAVNSTVRGKNGATDVSGAAKKAGKGTKTGEAPANADETEKKTKAAQKPKPLELDGYKNEEEFRKTALALWVVDSNNTNPTMEDLLEFTNAESFEDAQKVVFEKLQEGKTRQVYEEIELPLMPVVQKMEERGVRLDVKYLKTLSTEYHKILDSLQKNIWKETGVEFNINSPKQLGEVLFEKLGLSGKNQKKTSLGAKSTKESELEKIKDMHPVVPLILEYREMQKLLSTYIDSMLERKSHDDRLHAHFVQTGTTTGRLSSVDPNMQNIPIKTELGKRIRNAFIAEKGFVLAGFDYSQIELRIAAFLSGDEKLLDIFISGGDIHAGVASSVFGVPKEKVDHEMRRRAKVINFGILYGMGVNALRTNLGTSREEAKNFYDQYFKNFSTLAAYLERTKSDAAKNGYTETFFGRRRYFPGIRSKLPFIKAASERMAINAPLQGTCADIIKLAMVRVNDYLVEQSLTDKVFLILTVHDELVFEVEESVVDKVVPKIKDIMEHIVRPEDWNGLPLIVNSSVGKNWGEMKAK